MSMFNSLFTTLRKFRPDQTRDDAGRFASEGQAASVPTAAGNVRSPEFQKWFAGSKVTDSNGEPMRVFHGTDTAFNKFDANKQRGGDFGKGFYFASSKSRAEDFGGHVIEVYLSLQNPYIVRGDVVKPNGEIEWGKTPNEEIAEIYPEAATVPKDEINSVLQRHGHDGLIIGDNFIAFHPNQIKSVFNRKPTGDPDISKAWDESAHPRNPKGSEKGGEFTHDANTQVNYPAFTNHPEDPNYRDSGGWGLKIGAAERMAQMKKLARTKGGFLGDKPPCELLAAQGKMEAAVADFKWAWGDSASGPMQAMAQKIAAEQYGGAVWSRGLPVMEISQPMRDVVKALFEDAKKGAVDLPDEITVYRGVKSGVAARNALESWSVDKDCAARFDGAGIFKATVPRSAVFMDRRSDSEYEKELVLIGGMIKNIEHLPPEKSKFGTVGYDPLAKVMSERIGDIEVITPESAADRRELQRMAAMGRVDIGHEYSDCIAPPEEIRKRDASKLSASCVMAMLEPADAVDFLEFASEIPDSEIYEKDGDFGRTVDCHATCLYSIDKTVGIEDVRAITDKFEPFGIICGRSKVFANPDKPYAVIVIPVWGGQLRKLNRRLKSLPFENDYPVYQGHITIAYTRPGMAQKYDGDDRFAGKVVKISNLVFSHPNHGKTVIPLGEVAKAYDPSQPRDEHGEWTKDGGAIHVDKPAEIVHTGGMETKPELKYPGAKTGRQDPDDYHFISTGAKENFYTLRHRFTEATYASSEHGPVSTGARERDYHLQNLSTDRDTAIKQAEALTGLKLSAEFDVLPIGEKRPVDWSVFQSGKYVGSSIHEVREKDPDYLLWIAENQSPKSKTYGGTVELIQALMAHELKGRSDRRESEKAKAESEHEARVAVFKPVALKLVGATEWPDSTWQQDLRDPIPGRKDWEIKSGQANVKLLYHENTKTWEARDGGFVWSIAAGLMNGKAPTGRGATITADIVAKMEGKRNSKGYEAKYNEVMNILESHEK